MQNQTKAIERAAPSAATRMEEAFRAVSFLRASEIGFAVYDGDLRLLDCNPAFRALRGLTGAQAAVGTPMVEIIVASMGGKSITPSNARAMADGAVARLLREGRDRIDFETTDAKPARIARDGLPGGGFSETVQLLAHDDGTAFDGYLGAHVEVKTDVQARAAPADETTMDRGQLFLALDNMADGFAVFDADGVLRAMNRSYRDLAPHLADALHLGARHEDIIRAAYRSGAVDFDGFTEESFVAFATRERLDPGAPTVDRRHDGRWVRFAARRLDDGGTIFTQTDVTEVKRQEERANRIDVALAVREAQLSSAVEAMHAGFIMFDAEQRMIRCNTRYREMFGFPEHVLEPGITRPRIMELIEELGLFNEAHMAESSAGYRGSLVRRDRHEFRYFMADGRVLQARFTPMEDGGSIVLFIDITADLETEARLTRYSRNLERSNAELQNFAYVASHDLQEPLRKIEAFGDRLSRKHMDVLPEGGQHYLERILDATGRMRQLINDLLSFSRVSSKERKLGSVDLASTVQDVLSDLQMRVEETGARVRVGGLAAIEADATQMRQLFQNLVGNALKFAREGVAPVVRIEGETCVAIQSNGAPRDVLRIRIADNGIGFEDRFKAQIFTIFQRLHGRTEYEGTGIGLATCRKIVERHHGTIDATGVPNEGATFTIDLPLIQPGTEA